MTRFSLKKDGGLRKLLRSYGPPVSEHSAAMLV